MEHTLKTWPDCYEAVVSGLKTYELRRADRDFAVGDTLILQEFDPATNHYSGRSCRKLVTYITPPGEWGLSLDTCAMALAAARTEGGSDGGQ